MYRHILLATDFAEDTAQVASRAAALATGGTHLSIIHVIEPLALAYGAEMPVDLGSLQEEIARQARARLDALGEQLGVPPTRRVLATGTIEREILRHAAEQGVDLIVIGSHSRKGLARLLGSSANAVLHHAACDVLAVRVGQQG